MTNIPNPFRLPSANSSSSDYFKPAEHFDHLVILEPPFTVERDVETAHGVTDATRVAKIIDVTDGTQFADAFIFPKGLQATLAADGDQPILARLGKGEASGGFSAPWQFEDPTDADIAEASAHLEADSAADEPF